MLSLHHGRARDGDPTQNIFGCKNLLDGYTSSSPGSLLADFSGHDDDGDAAAAAADGRRFDVAGG